MKNHKLIAIGFLLISFGLSSCEKKTVDNLSCNQIQLNKQFTTAIDESWCLEGSDWKIKFGPFIEDSRCNVSGVECIWAGRFVMAANITSLGETVTETFFAENNWQDTIYSGPYKIILAKVKPETRTSMEPLAPSAYSFDVIVTQ